MRATMERVAKYFFFFFFIEKYAYEINQIIYQPKIVNIKKILVFLHDDHKSCFKALFL